MPRELVSTIMNNLTEQCAWMSQENRTEARVTELLDSAACLFLSILPYERVVSAMVWVFVLLTLLSFLINGLTLFGLEQSDDLTWEPRIALLKNLILSDLVQTGTLAPAVIHSLLHRRTMAFSTWCYVQYFVGTTSIFSSLITITCMALERYLYVCHAIHYLVIITQMRLRLTLSLIWVVSIFISSTNLALLHTGTGQKNEPVTTGLLCEPDMMEQHMGFPRAPAIYRKLTGTFMLLLCLLAHAFSYLRMYRDACNAVIQFNAVNSTARRTVLFYCGMLFLQLLPLLLKVASDALWEVQGTEAMLARASRAHRAKPPSLTAAVMHLSLLVMLLVPPCINPLVYGLRNVETRHVLFRMCRKWRKRRSDRGARGVELRRVGHVRPKSSKVVSWAQRMTGGAQ